MLVHFPRKAFVRGRNHLKFLFFVVLVGSQSVVVGRAKPYVSIHRGTPIQRPIHFRDYGRLLWGLFPGLCSLAFRLFRNNRFASVPDGLHASAAHWFHSVYPTG